MHHIAARHRPDAQAARLCATSTASTPSCGSSPPCAARSASRSSSCLAAKVDELSSGRRPPASRRQQWQLDRRFSELHCLVQPRKFAGSIPVPRTSVCAVQRLYPRLVLGIMGQIWAKPDRLPQHEAPVPGQRMFTCYTLIELSQIGKVRKGPVALVGLAVQPRAAAVRRLTPPAASPPDCCHSRRHRGCRRHPPPHRRGR